VQIQVNTYSKHDCETVEPLGEKTSQKRSTFLVCHANFAPQPFLLSTYDILMTCG
jgi:hypothetical protein